LIDLDFFDRILKIFIFFFILNNSELSGQRSNIQTYSPFPKVRLEEELSNYNRFQTPILRVKNKDFKFFNVYQKILYLSNNGHPNIDNNGEIFSPSNNSRYISTKIAFQNSWLILDIEPYQIYHKNIFNTSPPNEKYLVNNTYKYVNNHLEKTSIDRIKAGFRNSIIAIHYNGIGIGYGYMSHWWGPGFHNALTLSTNAPSQKTYSLGTFRQIAYKNFGFEINVVAKPYKNLNGNDIFYSGMRTKFTIKGKPHVSFGFHRTFLSGDFLDMSETTNINGKWNLNDAISLVIKPMFGQDKKDLSYVENNTPGFDRWDEVLSGFVKLYFPEDNIELYLEIASDDSRGNMSDLMAHWDHTLAYLLGFKKFSTINKAKILFGIEYFSNKTSNTFKNDFYRGSANATNYYSNEEYDNFTYRNRRMGAHSGSSSDDLIFLLGIKLMQNTLFISYSQERHGIKSMEFPELKREINLTYRHNINFKNSIIISAEHETIRNFSYTLNNSSTSRFISLGYSWSFR